MHSDAIAARRYRERLLADPHRPGYHFAIPEGNGIPGDPNGAFFADGRYHLMYLYEHDETGGFHWGHLSSTDLLHWRSHPDALAVENGDRGCFSGGAFVDDDQTAYLTFWKFPAKDGSDAGGIDIAFSRPPYERWERIRPLAIEGSPDVWGTMEIGGEHIGCADPGNIWKRDGFYYLQTGCLCVLNAYGREENSEAKYRGDWTDLFRSRDLKHWEHVRRFYVNPHLGSDWPDATEDDMCPSLLPLPNRKSGGQLTEKWLQLFIAHNKGGQYYIGELKDEQFFPEQHGRFSWQDNTYFAPEALMDDRNRHIAWFWLLDNLENDYDRFGWTGVYGFPRVFWYDGALRMAPAEELDRLQYNGQVFDVGVVDGEAPIAVKNGLSFRLKATVRPGRARRTGFAVRVDGEAGERTEIYVDLDEKALVMDATRSGSEGRRIVERAPFDPEDGKPLTFDLFVDRSVVEVYLDERQAICRRVFPTRPTQAVGVTAIAGGAEFGTVKVWEMMETNLY